MSAPESPIINIFNNAATGDPERMAHVTALAEIAWVMENSASVTGLRLNGEPMEWAEVRALYLPSWRDHFEENQ